MWLAPGGELLALGVSCLVRVFARLGPHGISLTSTWAEDPGQPHRGQPCRRDQPPIETLAGRASLWASPGDAVSHHRREESAVRTTPLETTDAVPGLPGPAPRPFSFG